MRRRLPIKMKKNMRSFVFACFLAGQLLPLQAANPALPLLDEPLDVSGDFRDFANLYYVADQLTDFDPATHTGKITYQRTEYSSGM